MENTMENTLNRYRTALESVGVHALIALLFSITFLQKLPVPHGQWVRGQMSSIDVAVVAAPAAPPKSALPATASTQAASREAMALQSAAVELSHPSTAEPTAAIAANSASFGVESGQADSGPIGSAEGRDVSVRERYLFELRLWIEGHKRYPAMSRRFGESGTVEVKFSVLRDGSIRDIELHGPSGHERLNQATLAMMQELQKFRPFPDELTRDRLELVLPIEYVLN